MLTVPGRLQGVRKVALVGLGPKDKAMEGYAALGKAVADIASKEKASSVGGGAFPLERCLDLRRARRGGRIGDFRGLLRG